MEETTTEVLGLPEGARVEFDPIAGCEVWVLNGAQVVVGDVVVFGSHTFRIDRIDPYQPGESEAARDLYQALGGDRCRVAASGPAFGMTLTPDVYQYRVLPRVFPAGGAQ